MASLPTWLNKEFMEESLCAEYHNGFKIVSCQIRKATEPGDNYGSEMYRAVLQILKNGIQETKSFIIKAELTSKAMKKVVQEANGFEREINAYTFVIPNLNKILRDCTPNKYQPYAAKCYYTRKGLPASVLVLEDLQELGFRLTNPSGGLDLQHSLVAINRLAVYHAASAVLFSRYPEKIEALKVSVYSESMRENTERLFNPFLKQLAAEVLKWPECQLISNKLYDLMALTFDHMMASVKTDDNSFNVFCHEDVWLNNIMFRFSEETGRVVDVRFVDFQMCHWTSPAIDLLYFINACAAAPIFKNPQILIEEYYKTLSETLVTLGHRDLCPPKQEIYDEFEKRHKFGVITGCVLRYVMYVQSHDAPDMEKVLKNEVEYSFPEIYKSDMKEMLPLYHQRGWL